MFYKFKPNQLQFAIHHSKTGVLENSLWVVKETAKKLDQENNKDAKNKFYEEMLLQGKKEELKLESIRQQIKDTNLEETQLRNTYERHRAV